MVTIERPSPFALWQPGDPIELQEVFVYFAAKFDSIDKPRSIAEGLISQEDISSLVKWFSALYGKPRNWCERDWQEELIDGRTASSREMFGALFLILASELCREMSTEDSVWPTVAGVMKSDRLSFSTLFVAGQPTEACKAAMAAGARRLGLRNLIDRRGTQEYFDTLKLQFGFTFKGSQKRLADWLDGLPCPMAVDILRSADPEYPDLGSVTFQETWRTLLDFRKKRIPESRAVHNLQASPWVRPSWIVELLRVLATKPARTASSVCSLNQQMDEICEPVLSWQYPSKPRLFLRLNEEKVRDILTGCDCAVFSVDGRVVGRWIAQSQDQWTGTRELPSEPDSLKGKPNLRPKLLFITTDEGKPLAEVDLQDLGIAEPLLLFDVRTGEAVDPESTIDKGRDYALLCDPDLSVADSRHFISLPQCTAHYLSAPISSDLKVMSEGALYWQPKTSERFSQQPVSISLAPSNGFGVDIGNSAQLDIEGVPAEAQFVKLVVGVVTYETIRSEKAPDVWLTRKPVTMTLRAALGEERVRVKFKLEDYARSVAPRLKLQLRGIAALETNSASADTEYSWRLLDRNRPLNIAGGAGRARLFAGTKSEVFEGPRLVGKSTARTLDFKDLTGWGWPLFGRTDAGSTSSMASSVEDRGCVGVYVQNLFGKPINKVWLRSPIQPGPKHSVLIWRSLEAEPIVVSGITLSPESDNCIWNVPHSDSVAALAISYEGTRLGSYFNPSHICATLDRPSPRLFATLRWLKIPVVNVSFRDLMQKAVFRAPVSFVQGWQREDFLSHGLLFKRPDVGSETVLRWFLMNYKENREDRLTQLVGAVSGMPTTDEIKKLAFSAITEISPTLAYNLAKAKIRDRIYRDLICRILAQILRLPTAATIAACKNALLLLTRQAADTLRVTPEILEKNISDFADYLDDQGWSYRQNEFLVRELGERSFGRAHLSAWLLLRALEGRKV